MRRSSGSDRISRTERSCGVNRSKSREPEPGTYDPEREVQLESGIYIQKPTVKEYRVLWLDTISGHFQIECDETYEQVKDILASAARKDSEWYSFTDPTYGHKNEVPAAVLQHPIAIVSQWRDLEAIKDQIEAARMQQRLAKLQAAKQGGVPEQVKQLIRRNQN